MQTISPENKKLAAACAITAVTVGTLSTIISSQCHKKNHQSRQSITEAAAALAALKESSSNSPSASPSKETRSQQQSEKNNKNEKEKEKTSVEIYESLESARQYMEFHFTPSRDSYTMKLRTISESYDFPTRVAQKFKVYLPAVTAATATVRAGSPGNNETNNNNNKQLRGLDLGCATGASVFEMSKYFDHVVGLDYSHAFIQLAKDVQASGAAAFNNKNEKVPYKAIVQGELTEARETSAPRNTYPERCEFVVGDATNLFSENKDNSEMWKVPEGVTFDGVLCVNLLDRVPDPMVVLNSFSKLLHRRGVLVLCDPYSWMENATPKNKWLGAVNENNNNNNQFAGKKSEDVVKEILSKDFELRTETEEPFLIRDHVRHYQLGFSHCTVWIRK